MWANVKTAVHSYLLSSGVTVAEDGWNSPPGHTARYCVYTLFFYKNLFYKNVEAEIDPNFKNVLRTFLRLRVD